MKAKLASTVLIIIFAIMWSNVATACGVNQNVEGSVSNQSNVTIENYLKDVSQQLISNSNAFEIKDGQKFSEPSNSNVKVMAYRGAYAVGYKFNYQDGSDNFSGQVTNVPQEDSTVYQTVRSSETKGNVFISDKGNRYIVNDNVIVFYNTIIKSDLNSYAPISHSLSIDVVKLNEKKVYHTTLTVFPTNDSLKNYEYENTTSIYTYTNELKNNDYYSLKFNEKQGVTKTTTYSIPKTEVFNLYTYGPAVYKLNPVTFNMGYTQPWVYVYEVFSQIAQPQWHLHNHDAFGNLYGSSYNAPITQTQQQSLIKPFTNNENNANANFDFVKQFNK
jgi:hypothetical protein